MSVGPAKFTIPILAVIVFAAMLGWFGIRRLHPDLLPGGVVSGAPDASPALAAPDATAKAAGSEGRKTAEVVPPGAASAAQPAATGPVGVAATPSPATVGGAAPMEQAGSDRSLSPAKPAVAEASPQPSGATTAAGVGPKDADAKAGAKAAGAAAGAEPPAKLAAGPANGAASPEPAKSEPTKSDAATSEAPKLPSFDVVRVEPSGDTVLAGRAAAGATVDLMRNGEPMARVMADMSGLFAIVPPALPPGSQEISLRTIAPDGSRAQSKQSVTIVIAPGRDRKPLVTVTAPDQPTVVLSRPDEPAVASAAAPAPVQGAQPPSADRTKPLPRAEVHIASVEAQGIGQLFVSGTGAPGATVRLYLNDAFVAPGAAGPDGRLSFSIERGIRPGAYQVRLDDVDPVSGTVKSRAQVPFNVPPALVASADGKATVRPLPDGAAAPAAAVASSARTSSPRIPAGDGLRPSGQVATAGPPGESPAAPGRNPTDAGPMTALPRTVGSAATGIETLPESGFASLQTDPGQVVVPEVNTAIVSRGDNLWSISKRIYGRGIRYTVIYDANTLQIRDPDLIYPGQIFVLPGSQIQGALR